MRIFNIVLVALILLLPAATHATPQIDQRFCQQLTKHTPDASITYEPGIDVHGKAVAPADLPGTNNIQLAEVIQIPLTADLLKTLNLPTSAIPFNPGSNSAIDLGMLTLQGNQVSYNGQPLSDAQQDNLAVLCLQPSGVPTPPDIKPAQ